MACSHHSEDVIRMVSEYKHNLNQAILIEPEDATNRILKDLLDSRRRHIHDLLADRDRLIAELIIAIAEDLLPAHDVRDDADPRDVDAVLLLQVLVADAHATLVGFLLVVGSFLVRFDRDDYAIEEDNAVDGMKAVNRHHETRAIIGTS